MFKLLAIFIGGGLGAILRYLIGIAIKFNFILIGTLVVNILGSFILGLLFTVFVLHADIPENIKLLLTTGFCGGLTTFSTFALESYCYFTDGEYIKGITYILLNLVLSLIATGIGMFIGKFI